MRVLFIPSPGLSHILPTVPLAHALQAAGHHVRYAGGGEIHAVAEAGLCGVDASPGADYAKLFIPDETDGVDPMHSDEAGVADLAAMFARVSGAVVNGALAFAKQWRPDLVVYTPTQGAGPLVAAALGIPCAELPLGPADGEEQLPSLIRAAMATDYERNAVGGSPGTRVRLMPMAPSIESLLPGPHTPGAWPVRYQPYNGGAILPEWLVEAPARPRIAVTLGTIDARWGGIAQLAPFIEAAGSVEAEFVLTLGGGDEALLGKLPQNVRVIEWLPLGVLLESCAGIIHHGGSGTIMTALVAGVPQCVIPQGSFQNIGRDVLVKRGIGFSTSSAQLGPAECRRLLEDDSMREAARDAASEAATMPPVADLVPRLVQLTR
ncbi:nucleotide disphospho-sugar-binding domain-containing protein [Micromonospora aurantiaca]|uniref:nucleotide disphospho-sugar-binding domain-containing protein n=1 Tax=Micromonospora aurantiaca (nom. illeg.) TaxID=47850 RepID=UPI000827AD37|nr:nucleotide disphospho-sugar-binding domain-containing protein [Micromonospora aurantiaca]SCL43601.1 UDP:flavonoid glycosyltransferase YjiC, YdhE family [Micromonospora aurantiaca]